MRTFAALFPSVNPPSTDGCRSIDMGTENYITSATLAYWAIGLLGYWVIGRLFCGLRLYIEPFNAVVLLWMFPYL